MDAGGQLAGSNGGGVPITGWSVPSLKNEKYTVEQVAWALRRCKGLIIPAARMLQCSQTTVHAYIGRYPELGEVVREGRTSITNAAELKLVEKIAAGDNFALGFWLKTQAGWSEKHGVEISGPQGGPIRVEAEVTVRERKGILADMVRAQLGAGYTLEESLRNVVMLGIPREALKLLGAADLELGVGGTYGEGNGDGGI